MDTKSRNIRYSIVMKTFAVFMVWVSFAGLFAAVFFMGKYSSEFEKSEYYESTHFSDLFGSSFSIAAEYAVSALSYDAAGTGNRPSKNIQPNKVNFKFAARDYKTGKVISNFDMKNKSIEDLKNEFSKYRSFLFYSSGVVRSSENLASCSISGYTMNLDFHSTEIFAAVVDKPIPGDDFYTLKTKFETIHRLIPVFIAIAAVSTILGICFFIYLILVAGLKEKKGEKTPAFIDWIYNDIHTVLTVYLVGLISNGADRTISSFNGNISEIIFAFLLLSISMMIGLSYVLSMVRHIKMGSIFKHTLVFAIFKLAGRIFIQLFSTKAFKPSTVVLLLVYGGVNSILFAMSVNAGGNGFLLFILIQAAFNIAVVYYVSKALTSITAIMTWVKEITKGNLEHKLDKNQLSPAFTIFANNIENLQAGIRHAVSEAIKGERLKTELITNVSHDLKTPLTSIINYVDLLKKENLEKETINEYISVLEEKSSRLKKLIEDLIEASKAASGDMTVNFSEVDLCSLVGQAVAEYNEKVLTAGLDVRVRHCEQPVVIRGDGNLVWRIMDNLLSNIIKYSHMNSRVYIDIEQTGTEGIITLKNISEMPLDISADQLLERFVRGDSSRSTDGSGLGLSIAKSLAEIQGGRLELSIDGDLFKVVVRLPVSMKD